MALETLSGIDEIGGFPVLKERPKKDDGSIDWNLFDEQRKSSPIYIDNEVNMISFRLQKGPIKEVGLNGCQVDAIIDAARLILEGLNKKFPCDENRQAIASLEHAIYWLEQRTKDREKREVEGQSKI